MARSFRSICLILPKKDMTSEREYKVTAGRGDVEGRAVQVVMPSAVVAGRNAALQFLCEDAPFLAGATASGLIEENLPICPSKEVQGVRGALVA